MDVLRLESPAKINLRLEILRKREDGYHDIRTIFQKISLYDKLLFRLKKEKGISITTDQPRLPVGKENLVYRAAQLMIQKAGFEGGIHIQIEKKIPLGAGLGGGSSNAATTLKALNQLFETNLKEKELMRMGKEIGADVPFFFLRGAAIGSGIGEKLKEIRLPDLWYILIYPNFEVSTLWAYRNYILTKRKFQINLHQLPKNPEEVSKILWNDLEEVVSRRFPQVFRMKEILYSVGAEGALMTGSGPTVFGIFSKEGGAKEAFRKVKQITKGKGWLILNAHNIPF
ncbi:MAG: 4-(cytidine 5'-diphospho)-2-C-methyl-D-erythritol kinase [Thermodesulfobacteriota bacterium]